MIFSIKPMVLSDLLGYLPDYTTVKVMNFNYGSPIAICSIFSNDLFDYDFADLHNSSVISLEPVGSTLEVTVLL